MFIQYLSHLFTKIIQPPVSPVLLKTLPPSYKNIALLVTKSLLKTHICCNMYKNSQKGVDFAAILWLLFIISQLQDCNV